MSINEDQRKTIVKVFETIEALMEGGENIGDLEALRYQSKSRERFYDVLDKLTNQVDYMRAPRQANTDKLDNPARPKTSHQAGTEPSV